MNAVLSSKLISVRNSYRNTIIVLMFEFHKFHLLEHRVAFVDRWNFFFPCWELSDGLQSGDTERLSQIDPDHRDFAPKEDNKKQIH